MVSGLLLANKNIGGWIYMEPLHDHNQKTYGNICRMYNEGIQRVAVVQPTGSGKSLLMAKLIEDNPDSRFFVLSTRHEINDQFKEKLDEKMLERSFFNIYCNMPNMKQEIMEALQPDYILLDEMHRALAKEWSKGINVLLKMYPDAKVLGLSATPIRYLDKCRDVVEELFGGNLACDMSLSQAILDGILPMARYVCGVYSYEKDAESLNKKIERSCNSEEEKKELLRELKVLKENLDKGHGVSDIFRKYIVTGSEKFVVFLKDTTHLGVMRPVIEKWFTDAGFTVRLYEVHCKNADRDKEFQAFKADTEDGIIKLCLSVHMVTEGIHGDVGGVIMLRETISPNLYFQMIGRAFSCGKKTIPLIFDLVANSQFISETADNFANELRGEIEKRKKECKKEGKDYEVGFDVDKFIIMDEFMDAISGFRAIEEKLQGDWDVMFQEYCKFYEKYGHGDVPCTDEYMKLSGWCKRQRKDLKNEVLKEKRKQLLDENGFIWDVLKYRFEKNVNDCIRFYEKYGKKPNKASNNREERSLGVFWNRNLNISNLPLWKRELLEQIPSFFELKSISAFEKFYNCALIYKEKFGNKEIKKGDAIEGLDLYQAYYNLKARSSELTDEQFKKLKNIGIDLNSDKIKNNYNKKIELARQAINEGVIISSSNNFYKGVNFYSFKNTHMKSFTEEELEIMNKLVPNPGCMKSVKIIDIKNKRTYVYPSINDAGRALYSEFHIVGSDKAGLSAIIKRLTGVTKNPMYKGFRFEYADDES